MQAAVERPATPMTPDGLLVEAALFGSDTFFDVPDHPPSAELPYPNAVSRGWQPLSLGPLAPVGVQLVDLSAFVPPELGGPDVEMDSAAHFYTGEVEGRNTLAIAFRSTDDGLAEFAFQSLDLRQVRDPFGADWGWDIYHAFHAPAVRTALAQAAAEGSGIEQILITGHSLGGILAELATARILVEEFPELVDRTITSAFGSPGSTGDASGAQVLNLVNSDDLIARLSELSPLFQANGAAREGRDLAIDRPEGELPDLAPEDLDTVEEVFAALEVPAYRAEHGIGFYIDDARALSAAEPVVPGIAGATEEPFRWLEVEAEKAIVGTEQHDALLGGSDHGEVLLGRGGGDLLVAGRGEDGIAGGDGQDWLYGGKGDDLLDGGRGNDHAFGWKGNDGFIVSAGHDRIFGGPGKDSASVAGHRDDFVIDFGRDKVTVRGELDGAAVKAELWGMEQLVFADASLDLGEERVSAASSDFLL